MGIVNWFTNNIESKERVLTRDLLSMAIADGEFMEEERQEIVRICHIVFVVKMFIYPRQKKIGENILFY